MNSVPIILLLWAAAFGQDASDSRRVSDPKAVELFKKTLAAQTEGGTALAIRDFQADLEVTIHETDEKTKERVRRSAHVTEFYRDRGADEPLFRRELTDVGGNRTIQGHDAELFWQKLGTTPARPLRGRESKDDLKRVKNEMARTHDYLRFLFLSNLEGPDVTLHYGGPATVKANGTDRAVEKVVRKRPREAPIDLLFGDSEGKPVLYGFSRMMESGKTELITFAVHRIVKSGSATALVPLVAEYREDGVITFEARAAHEPDLKFNTGLPDALFRMP